MLTFAARSFFTPMPAKQAWWNARGFCLGGFRGLDHMCAIGVWLVASLGSQAAGQVHEVQ